MRELFDDKSITRGTALSRDTAMALVVADALARDENAAHGGLFGISRSTVRELGFFEVWLAGVAPLEQGGDTVLVVSEWGDVGVVTSDDVTEETIPVTRGPIRDLRLIDGCLFAVGTDHQVFQRQASGRWTDISPPEDLRQANPEQDFEGIDGFSRDDLYIAATFGAIWHRVGDVWTVIPTATNLAFRDICCAGDGRVYACGQAGAFVTGRDMTFELIEMDRPLDDLWGVAAFDGQIYVSMINALLRLEDGQLVPHLPAMEKAGTFYNLSSLDGCLWSFGRKDVLRFDGTEWSDLQAASVEYHG